MASISGAILLVEVAQLVELGVAEERVVVEVDLGVEREDLAVLGDDSGLISSSEQSSSTNALVERRQELSTASLGLAGLEAEPVGELRAPATACKPIAGSIASLRIFSGCFAATSSISMPPSVDAITVTRPVARSSEHAEVELVLDREALLDEQALDLLALGAGLVRDELHAEDLLGASASASSRGLGDLDAAALAAAAGVDLRLDDDDLGCRSPSAPWGSPRSPPRAVIAGMPIGHRHAVLA